RMRNYSASPASSCKSNSISGLRLLHSSSLTVWHAADFFCEIPCDCAPRLCWLVLTHPLITFCHEQRETEIASYTEAQHVESNLYRRRLARVEQKMGKARHDDR